VAAKYGKNLLGIKYHYYNKHHLSTGIFTWKPWWNSSITKSY
jgi:hypothetical protein